MPIVPTGRVKTDIRIRPIPLFTWRAASCVTILGLKVGTSAVSPPGRVEGKTLNIETRRTHTREGSRPKNFRTYGNEGG